MDAGNLIESGALPFPFTGACSSSTDPVQIASEMKQAINLDTHWAAREPNWNSALRKFREHVDLSGVLVAFSGVVGNNTYRRLDPDEFQGFALVDDYAPLIFVNSANYLAAQMFTLAHELAHILVAEPGVSKFNRLEPASGAVENLCNAAAAEFLVPERGLRLFWPGVKHKPIRSMKCPEGSR